jgi:diketogulonate reductase-like aldo/keto reductase
MDGAAGAAAMAQAIAAGYRLLDTAAKYGNEWAVGEAIMRSGVDRRELFVTSKLRGADHGRASTRAAVAASLDIFRFSLSDPEMDALAALDQGEDAAVDSDLRVEF